MVGTFLRAGAPAPRLLLLAGAIGLFALAVAFAALNGAPDWSEGYLPFRSPTDLDARFWVAWTTGVIAALLSSWVWVLKPRDGPARLYALSGLATLGFCFAAAGLLIPTNASPAFLSGLIGLNVAAASAFGVIIIALFAVYPTPLPGARWIILLALAGFGGWVLWAMNGAEDPRLDVHRITLAEMLVIVLLASVQVMAARGDPVRFAIAAWLGACVLLGAGGFIVTVALPSAFGASPLIANEYAFAFFLALYGGLAVGLLRYRVFGLGRWAFQLLFSVGATLALLLVDALLILVLSFDAGATIGWSLFVAALIYLPMRAWLWGRIMQSRALDQASLARAIIDIGLQPTPERRDGQWQALLMRLFAPLSLAPNDAATPQDGELQEDGRVLVTPSLAGLPSMVLRDRSRGRGLFSPEDAATVRELLALAAHLDASRAAHERGAAAERARIARDIHDNLGAQLLSALHARDVMRKDALIRDAIGEVRSVVRNAGGADEAFDAAVADLRAETAERMDVAGVTLEWRVDGQAYGAPRPLAMLTLRALVREGVSNVLRHSGARHAAIEIMAHGVTLRLRIRDDGVGLTGGDAARQGRGLENMKQRVAARGGRFSITAQAQGVLIEAEFCAFDGASEAEPGRVPGGLSAG